MRNDSALRLGFAGCGTSLAKVQQQFLPDTANAAELLDKLGSRLMVAGQGCLPVQHTADPQTIIEQAQAWPLIDSTLQRRLLERLWDLLIKPPPQRKYAPGESCRHPMLPTEMGAWDSERPLPSCLGLLIILAAYAGLTGAPSLIGSVQRMSAEPATIGLVRLLSDAFRWSAERLPEAFYRDRLPHKLRAIVGEAREATTVMASRQQFHGALVIRLADGRWVSLDPYMNNFSFFNPEDRPLDALHDYLAKSPSATVSVLGRGYWEHLPTLEHQLREVYGIIEYLLGLPRDVPLMELSRRLHHLAQIHAGIAMKSPEDILSYACTEPPSWQVPTSADARILVSSQSTDHLQHELRERLLMVLVNVWAQGVFVTAQNSRRSEPHHAMVLSSPARTLALWTIITLRRRTGAGVVAADLLEYLASDVALYHAWRDQRRGRTTKAEEYLIRQLRAGFRGTPESLVHPLLLDDLA